MTKKRITLMLFIASVTLGSLLATGCEDNTGPTIPTVQYRPQKFFMAVSDGHQVVGNHNQSSAVTINWNGSAGTNSPAPVHVALVPHCDGVVDSHDNGAWDSATEVDIPLTPVTPDRDSGITNAKMKVVFNFATPATAYFLIRWQDNTEDIWKHPWKTVLNPFPPPPPAPQTMEERQFGAPDYEEDWVGFMWDVWKKYESGTTGPVYFEKQTANFQTQGCSIACHDPAPEGFNPMSFMDDSQGRTYSNPVTGETVNASPILDVWFWGAGRTNCGDDPSKTVSTREPSWMVDAQITPGGDSTSDNHGIRRDDDTLGSDNTKQQFEVDGLLPPPYAFNFDSGSGNVGKEREDDPNSGLPYIWSSTGKQFDLTGWLLGSLCGGWINNPGLSKAGNVQGQGAWADGWWTLEIEHQIDDGDANDTIIGTYNPH
jgi:hypothetical protein